MTPKVTVLCEGTIKRDGTVVLEAHSSSTLVESGRERIVVDTSTPRNRERIVEALRRLGLSPGQITMVVITHDHHDHQENNDLFPHAKVVRPAPGLPQEGVELAEGVRLLPTPGHTPESVSVLVQAERRYAIVGDAIPTEDNYRKWVPPRLNYDAELALDSMRRLVELADVVVPGHGPAFEIRGKLI